MATKKIALRFFAHRTPEGLWVAHCIDLSLAAQADSFEEAKEKIQAQVRAYCEYVNSQHQDPEFQRQLMSRKSPLSTRVHYYLAASIGRLFAQRDHGEHVRAESWKQRHAQVAC